MKLLAIAPGAALAALVLAGGCSTNPGPEDKAETLAEGTELARVDVARPPPISDDANPIEAEPLNEAGEIASEIEGNTMIGRVPVEGGLAWLQDGEVVRTASHDGQRIAYFHPGENRPFLVQKGERAFAFREGRPQLAYDDDGRPARISGAARAEAERLAAVARREAAAAEQTLPADPQD